MLNKLSLRMRITLITLLILLIILLMFAIFTSLNAQHSMFNPLDKFQDKHIRPAFPKNDMFQFNNNDFRNLMEQSKQDFMVNLFITITIAFVFAASLMYYLSGKMLKVLTNFSNQIETIDQHNLSIRLEEPNTNDEISSLSHSFNNMLEKIERAYNYQKEFSENAAHELKTPLTTMITNIEVLEINNKPTKQEYKEVLEVVKESSFQLSNLITSLLNLNDYKINKLEEIDVRELLDHIINEHQQSVSDKNIKISIKGNVIINSDKVLFKIALSNIISNAIRYNKENGSIEIKISSEQIIIKDYGIGIDQAEIDNVFQPFNCVDKSRSKTLGGNGLGLSIVKKILNQLNIKYQLKSIINEGTTFIIDIKNIKK